MTRERTWSVTGSPRVARLNGVESSGERAYCAGDHGVLFERTGPSQWTAVFTTGPNGDGRNLYDLSLTDDGHRVWFCGVAGTLGVYDRRTDAVETFYEPYDITATFRSVSANGPAGEETVHAADDNGEILRGIVAGGTDDSRVPRYRDSHTPTGPVSSPSTRRGGSTGTRSRQTSLGWKS